jgi:aminoglycoside 3-N-acetyltransferase I
MSLIVRRIGLPDFELARRTFDVMAHTFGEHSEYLNDHYLEDLLGNTNFWAVAAVAEGAVIGGLSGWTLSKTSAPSREVFIYDIAVAPTHQRQGVGNALVDFLRGAAAEAGISLVWVLADNEDAHALDFYRKLGGAAAPVTLFDFDSGGAT